MPLNTDPRWSCNRKTAYPTEKVAKTVANRINYHRNAGVHVYGCPHCGRWHIGKHMKAEASR